VDSINSLLKGPVMTKACEETKHFHPDHSQPEFRHTEDWTVRCRGVIHKNIQEDPWNLPSSIKTLVDKLCRRAQLLAALRSRYNNAGEYQEDSKETSRKWLEQVAAIGVLLHFQSSLAPHLKEERTMLEDTKAALLDLDKVTVFFKQMEDEYLGHPSGVSVLCVSSELCNRLGACHITMCATGKHRCTLSVTLEQSMILARNHGLIPRCIMQTMDIMRKQGTRVELFAKNLKVMDQMAPSAPRLFRLFAPPSDGEL
ncbi:LOW QUALITY PROTEIN: hypothetical protein CRUP_035292, partial [Coryphaenoides rupestris]